MSSARWPTITKIFEAALEKRQSERDRFVQEACGGDQDLQSEVNRLLAADEAAGSFLDKPAIMTLPPQSVLNRNFSLLEPGTLISARFEIVRFIGQGGMGQVYEALDLKMTRPVAIKVPTFGALPFQTGSPAHPPYHSS